MPEQSVTRSELRDPEDKSTGLFDLRVLIGALMSIYGVVLIVTGFFTGSEERAKADGIHINLWMGIGMLVAGLFFLAWWKARPLTVARSADTDEPAPGSRSLGNPGH